MSAEGEESGAAGREQDRYLPIANISRIMKKALPGNAKIAKDAKEAMQECISEFISFITSEASDKCLRERRKTINGDDLLWAMQTLGFEEYQEPLKIYLQKFREAEHWRGNKVHAAAAYMPSALLDWRCCLLSLPQWLNIPAGGCVQQPYESDQACVSGYRPLAELCVYFVWLHHDGV
ncbi:transcription factor NF-Y, CCAAT-binding like protein [Scenedesmus sp. NREL 46B-D3]|nr:transcription factor NF-Y, CCAAT-binding like protein [Scenedesmus sp. NREL 46B-D3]